MKEIIDYYYSIKLSKIYKENNEYYFFFNDSLYLFCPYYGMEKDSNNLINIVNVLSSYGIKCHILIENKNNDILTNVDGVNYILLKIVNVNNDISIININNYCNKTLNIFNNTLPNWYNLWQKKTDYIEESLFLRKNDNLFLKTIDYYIGLAENAIFYLYNVEEKYSFINKDLCLCHYRINYPLEDKTFLNPLNFIIDVEVRDIAEYLKIIFFNGEDAFSELKVYLSLKKISLLNANLLYARLLFPTYYFDIYEKSISGMEVNNDAINIIKKQKEYEKFLKKAYFELSKYATLEKVDWIIY